MTATSCAVEADVIIGSTLKGHPRSRRDRPARALIGAHDKGGSDRVAALGSAAWSGADVGVEGNGSYGAGLTRHPLAAGWDGA